MSNTLGNNLKITVFGESHGPYIGISIDGLSAGVEINNKFIDECLTKRRPSATYETKANAEDIYETKASAEALSEKVNTNTNRGEGGYGSTGK